jgi:hypothetical protein
MKLSLSIFKQSLKLWSFGLVVAFSLLVPNSAFSQEEQQQDQEISTGSNSQDQQPDRTNPVVGGNLWDNSAGSTIGTSSDNNNSSNASSTGPASRPGVAQRPGATLGIEPPPNPDVPFDDNMNLVFLASALVFAFWIARKKTGTKTAAIKSNK